MDALSFIKSTVSLRKVGNPMTKPLHHLQFHQLPPSYDAITERDYHHLIIMGTGEKANGLHGKYMNLGENDEERKLIEPFVVKTPEELLNKAGEGTAYDVYRSLCAPFEALEVSILLIDYEYLEDTFSLLENVDFSFLVFDQNMRLDAELTFVRETELLSDPTINHSLLDRTRLFTRYIEVADKAAERGRIIHAISLLKVEDELTRINVFNRLKEFRYYENHEFVEKGKFISLVLDQLQTEFAHSYYAALALTQDVHESPTNKDIGDPVLKQELEEYEHVHFDNYGIVTMIDSYHKGVIFSNCSTAIITDDQLHKHFPNQKIAQYSISITEKSLDMIIGMPINRVLQSRVKEILESVRSYLKKNKGYLKDMGYTYEFKHSKGEMYLTLILVPITSIQAMKIETQIRVIVR